MFEDKLINDIYKWVAGSEKVPIEKEKLLKIMVRATLDYLRSKGMLNLNVKTKKVDKLAN